MLPALSVGLLSAAPLDGAKRRCARNLTNSPTDEPRAGAHHHGEEILRCALTDRREPGAGQSGRPYFRSSVRRVISPLTKFLFSWDDGPSACSR